MQKRSLARRVVLLVALLAAGLVLAMRTRAAGDALCSTLRSEMPARLGLDVKIAMCRIDPLTQTVLLSDVSIYEPGRTDPTVSADEAEVSLRSIFPGSITLDSVRLKAPKVSLVLEAPVPGEPNDTHQKKSSCPLHVLERLKVQHLEIFNAHVKVAMPGKGSAEVEGLDLEWKLKRGVLTGHVELKSGTITTPTRSAMLSKSLVEAELDVDDEALSIQRGEIGVEGAHLNVTGTLEALCDPEPRLGLTAQIFVPVAGAMRVLGVGASAGGNIWSRFSVSGKPQTLAVKGTVQGSDITIGNAHPGDFTAKVGWSGKELTLEDFQTKAGAGSVHLSGVVKLETGLPAKLRFDTQDASLARILERAGIGGAWVDLPGTVKGSLSVNLLPRRILHGDAVV